jgi:hypothetical protein
MGSAFSSGQPRKRRPGYDAERKRRRAFVRAHLRQHGERIDGKWQAVCQVCGRTRILPLARWWADHVTPVALGGDEHGPLRLSCAECQVKQGSQVANAVNPMARARKRKEERHPGLLNPPPVP